MNYIQSSRSFTQQLGWRREYSQHGKWFPKSIVSFPDRQNTVRGVMVGHARFDMHPSDTISSLYSLMLVRKIPYASFRFGRRIAYYSLTDIGFTGPTTGLERPIARTLETALMESMDSLYIHLNLPSWWGLGLCTIKWPCWLRWSSSISEMTN